MLEKIWKFCIELVRRFYRDGCPLQAAGLSYVSLLSLVPLMTVSLSILTAFPQFKGLGDKLQHFIFSNFVAESAQVVQHQLNIFIQQAGRLSVTGTFFLLVTAVLMIFTMEQAFNNIWRVKKQRNAIQAFLMYWAVLTLTPILVGIGFVISTRLMAISFVSAAATMPEIKKFALAITPFGLTFLGFTLLYTTVPNCKVKIRYAIAGALVAATFFEFAKIGFTFYITNFPTYQLLYGALAIIPIFLIWLCLSWMIVLFGAIVSHMASEWKSAKTRTQQRA